jgi:uncharacterized protein (TIGR02217 family)
MTTFIEQSLPDTIRVGLTGGPSFLTEIATTKGGWSARNVARSTPLRKWDLDYVRTRATLNTLLDFFHVVQGAAIGFRLEDPFDYQATVSNGRLGTTAIGTGLPTYQLIKRYTLGSDTHDRTIVKPQSGGVTVYRYLRCRFERGNLDAYTWCFARLHDGDEPARAHRREEDLLVWCYGDGGDDA